MIYNKLTKWSPIAGRSRQRRDGTFDSISCWNPIHQIYTLKDIGGRSWMVDQQWGRSVMKLTTDAIQDLIYNQTKYPTKWYEIEGWDLIITSFYTVIFSLFVRWYFALWVASAIIHPRKIAAKQMISCRQCACFFVRAWCHNHKRTEIDFFTINIHWFQSFLQYFIHLFVSKFDNCMIEVCLGFA